ncbi:NUDIX domain-containing protein [Robertmurraya korlensis]|uniref:NUDIX hydrolase n=1 Tax=Robertmurraya korlensis TaxID=519977 RepID=UPI00203B24D8|nr:NUDIX domain-containing protein [Robertmurraya korlensis]MCM3600794.1 NUDIX domain-containing protein [Robertmurraya korlensis]
METELLRIFNEDHEPIGVATRAEIHEKGYWHETFHYWLMEKDQGIYYIFLQLRSPKKKDYPNLLDITAAGHLLANETVEDGIREVKEEIGLTVRMEELMSLGILKYSVKMVPLIDNELAHVFLHRKNVTLDSFVLQEEEVVGIYRMKFTDFSALWRDDTEHIPMQGFEVKNGERYFYVKSVGKEQFVPHDQSFYVALINKIQKELK